jgi:four helix bundle protein
LFIAKIVDYSLMKVFSFEKLDVWVLSRQLTKEIYQLTMGFPENEKFGMTVQIRRAAVSVVSNIAEGTSRTSGKEQARFSEIAYSSLMEVLTQLIIANDIGYIGSSELNKKRILIEEISNKLNKLRKFQLSEKEKIHDDH